MSDATAYLDAATHHTLGAIADAGFVVLLRQAGSLFIAVATDASNKHWTTVSPDPCLAVCQLADLLDLDQGE